MERILIVGANGQIGSELTGPLAARHGAANVIAADIGAVNLHNAARYVQLDVLDRASMARLVAEESITQVYQLAALLSATGEQMPLKAWSLNMDGLINVLEVARARSDSGAPLRVFWPSSIAAFGPNTPGDATPQHAIMDPTSIYGISKLAGERLCQYYYTRYGVDVRSIRYPGIISYKSPPGGGTTDYAIAIFHAALRGHPYECYLAPDTTLPMIYMPDAVRATIELMDAPAANITIRSSYNVAGLSFNPRQLAAAISAALPQLEGEPVKGVQSLGVPIPDAPLQPPQFHVSYRPDARQQIAATWPHSIDDSQASADWGWQPRVGLSELVADMLRHIGASAAQPA